jgi:[ribosomal protein S5]-alanine N-acetyltransferase
VRRPRGSANPRRQSKALETGRRVFLRVPEARDAPTLAALVRASQAFHRPWIYPPTTARAVARAIASTGPRRLRLLVCRRADGVIVGVVNLNEIVRAAFQSAYLGYYVFQPAAGQGYMTEGLGLVLRHAFRRLGLHRLEANIQPGNRASRALVRRLGFRKEGYSPRYLKIGGRWRDHERWAIVREAWAPGRVARGSARGTRPASGAALARKRKRP